MRGVLPEIGFPRPDRRHHARRTYDQDVPDFAHRLEIGNGGQGGDGLAKARIKKQTGFGALDQEARGALLIAVQGRAGATWGGLQLTSHSGAPPSTRLRSGGRRPRPGAGA
ncbi:MAG: hypothetical protein MZV64_10265 [Ignavibacteriales bacterium]|nr:hypothetical protein [Ignavibacteriales bacterium]